MLRADPVVEKGLAIFRLMEARRPAVFDTRWWAGRMMEAAIGNPDLKLRLFRFIDVLPALTSSRQVARHVDEYFLSGESGVPAILSALLAGAASAAGAGIGAAVIRRNVSSFSRIFIPGESPGAVLKTLRRIRDEGRSATVDLLGEAALSEEEADRYGEMYLSLVETLSREMEGWPARGGAREERFPRLNVSVKISSLYSRIGPLNADDSVERVKGRLRPVFRKVREAGGFVNLDMETTGLREITMDVFRGLMEEPEFSGWDGAGLALQAYLRSAASDVEGMIAWARARKRRVTIRLVKGAYWEYERSEAARKGWPQPVFLAKAHADASFERCVETILSCPGHAVLAAATHNVRSIARVLAVAERLALPPEHYEFQMLYGMAEPVKRALTELGHPVREYVPVGEPIPGMAYFVRRLLENTSNEGFLKKRFVGNEPPEALLAEPETCPPDDPPAPAPRGGDRGAFANEPPLDFSIRGNREAFRAAILKVKGTAGRDLPLVVAGAEHRTDETLTSRNPARPDEVVCRASALSRETADRALTAAREAGKGWGRRPPEERAGILFRAAEIARRRRLELAAWEVLEVGKNWAEADADVAEAIDFLEYYGREMMRLGAPVRMGSAPGEDNRYFYRPRGVGLVIAPWNFPLAISVGMVSAALVAGNAVLYKPSTFSPMVGWQAFDLFREAGVPAGVLNFVPGRGEAVGDYLVGHREVDFILFTGSLEVGLGIVEKAGRTAPGQAGIKRVVVETGGKNAIIVDADADLDQAVPGVIQSAFGYQGQKCSACSRAIVLSECYERFLRRLVEAVRSIAIGPPEDPAHFMGPVIDASAASRIREFIGLARAEGRVAAEIPVPGEGYYVSPTVVTDLPAGSRLLREEIFGPVLPVIRVGDFDEALAAANDSAYALTGGIYSRSPANVARAREEFDVGNLYVNRGITGALVGRQPFGGFRMSGVGSKAGGPDYLLQFMAPRVVTENTMRRGFTPEDL